MTQRLTRLGMVIAALITMLLIPAGTALTAPVLDWSAVWATAQQRPDTGMHGNWSAQGFADQTVRQTIRVSAGGPALRIRLSNLYGREPLALSHATVARSVGGAAVAPESLRPLTVGLASAFEIAPGAELSTDPVPLAVSPGESLTVTMYFARPTGPATHHAQAAATTYRAAGNHAADATATPFTETSRSWYYLAGVDVLRSAPRPDVTVAFGDSITDGYLSTTDANRRYPDELAQQLTAAGRSRPVLNAGISGNRVTVDSALLGDSALSRFRRDVLQQPGISTVIVLEGINDIGLSGGPDPDGRHSPAITAEHLIDSHRDLIRQARTAGIRIIGATILPFAGSPYFTPDKERIRLEVNTWIRTSGEYDAVVDLDTALASPTDRTALNPTFDSGDHLHPNDSGYRAMAAAVTRSGL
ncbi:SGNH/GDSL hydrolase family protein [Nocardia huaxiensis]|uniref:SGNH/GDSL hydrolase family protein n=1 Tax=Nocardia huaxiensis TaxID=2755382 RepID=UPI0023E81B37|nr:SGNH/GDSL hydrolase family protein [Nocardia huaxiensis]